MIVESLTSLLCISVTFKTSLQYHIDAVLCAMNTLLGAGDVRHPGQVGRMVLINYYLCCIYLFHVQKNPASHNMLVWIVNYQTIPPCPSRQPSHPNLASLPFCLPTRWRSYIARYQHNETDSETNKGQTVNTHPTSTSL